MNNGVIQRIATFCIREYYFNSVELSILASLAPKSILFSSYNRVDDKAKHISIIDTEQYPVVSVWIFHFSTILRFHFYHRFHE